MYEHTCETNNVEERVRRRGWCEWHASSNEIDHIRSKQKRKNYVKKKEKEL
jgi:hypothetical protein